jgi:hypothetical protein
MRIIFIFLLLSASLFSVAQKDEKIISSDTITIKGAVKNEIKISTSDLKLLPDTTLGSIDIVDHKGEFRKRFESVKGISLKKLLERAEFTTGRIKDLFAVYFVFKAADGYTIVYSWNELFNSEAGKNIFIVTQHDGVNIDAMPDRPMLLIMQDSKSGRPGIKELCSIQVLQAQ